MTTAPDTAPTAGAGPRAGLGARAVATLRGLDAERAATALAPLVLLFLTTFYLRGLDAWLINDDEGSYLYAAWRISLGELPYRDFLTPQLPAFLFPGGALMALTGPSAWSARALAVGVTLLAGVATWAAARRLFGAVVGLLAGTLLLLHPDVYAACRVYRPEPFMLAFQALGTWAFVRAAFPAPARDEAPDRRWLAVSGAAFGIATLTKLFGPWPLAGLLLWLLHDARSRARPWRTVTGDVAATLLACGLAFGIGMGALVLAAGPATVFQATVGHHLMQGAAKPFLQILREGLALGGLWLRDASRAVPIGLAIALGLAAARARDRRALLFAWPLVTALLLVFLSRDRYVRHLLYLAPFVAVLFALGCARLHAAGAKRAAARGPDEARWLRWSAVALALAVLSSWYLLDRDLYQARSEDGTWRIADLVELLSAPDEILLSDYSELNFYGRRPTSYSAASLSSGAVQSGQITWARIRAELEELGADPALLLLETGSPYSHLEYLQGEDRAAYDAWVAERYQTLGVVDRGGVQAYELGWPRDRAAPAGTRFQNGPRLLAGAADRDRVTPGERVTLRTAWRAAPGMAKDLAMSLRLVDDRGRSWAQVDGGLHAAGGRPTGAWGEDELTADRLTLRVPPGTPPGDYDLRLGLYRRDDPGPLALIDEEGRTLGPSLEVGRLRVEPWRPSSGAAGLRRELALQAPAEALAGGGLELLGAGTPATGTLEAGEVLAWPLAWRVAQADPRAAAARITLVDPESGVTAADLRLPLPVVEGAWQGGEVFRQEARIPILADAASGRYPLRLGLEDGEGRPIEGARAALGTIDIAARDLSDVRFELPAGARPVGTELGEHGALAAMDAPRRLEDSGALDVRLYWRAAAPSAVPYAVTVQLLDPSGRPVAQHDGEPAEGARPTTGWLPGEIVEDHHRIALPEDLAPGRYRLVAALYAPLTGERLPATAPPGDGLIELGNVAIE